MKEVSLPYNEISRRHFIALILQLIAFANLPSCKKTLPAFDGSISISPFVAEDHSQFLTHWAEVGIRDAALINIDAHDDIIRIEDEKISALKDIYVRRDWKSFAAADKTTSDQGGLFGIANWIYAGGKLGIFSEVYWVMPHQVSGVKESDLKMLLSKICFNPDDVASFKLESNILKGNINGVPFSICSIDALPIIKKPLLLSFDIDFLPAYSANYKINFVSAIYQLFKSLYANKYSVLDAAVCFSINGEYLQPHLRWVGDAVIMLLKNPELLKHDSPSELLNLQQYLENAYRSFDADAILKATDSYSKSQTTDPSLSVYRAFGYVIKGDANSAYNTALLGCRKNKLYCSVMSAIGTIYYGKREYRIAEQFYKSGFEIDPLMKVGLFQYANCMSKMKKYNEALAIYQKDVIANGEFPTEFMMVDVYIKIGNRSLAESTLKNAILNLKKGRAPSVQNRALADAFYSIFEYCKLHQLNAELGELLHHPMVLQMYIDFPENGNK